ncbi:hypothetical protein BVY01_02835 [bacterium I07]|nr:hypothetical protein BVY01_02835 [bacterium I07]
MKNSFSLSGRLTPIQWTFVALVSLGIYLILHSSFREPEFWPFPFGIGQVHGERAEMMMKARSEAFHNADLIILGSSTIRNALVNDRDLSNGLSAGLSSGSSPDRKKPFQVLKLTASALTLMESLFVLRNSDIQENQQFIICLTPKSFAREPERSIYSLISGQFLIPADDFVIQIAPDLGVKRKPKHPAVLKVKHFISSNRIGTARWFARLHTWLLVNLYRLKPEIVVPLTDRPPSPAALSRYVEIHQEIMRNGYFKEADGGVYLLEELIKTIQGNKARAVLLEYPLRAADNADARWRADYQNRVDNICARYNVPYYNINDQANLLVEDFIDRLHVTSKGREKWSNFFISWYIKNRIYDQ